MKFLIKILAYAIVFLVFFFFAWLLCDIDAGREYGWLGGFWHGSFFVVNWLRSLFTDALYKADVCTRAYNVFYYVFAFFNVIGFLAGLKRNAKMLKDL